MTFALAKTSLGSLSVTLACAEIALCLAFLGLICIGGPALIIWVVISIVRGFATPADKRSPVDRTHDIAVSKYVKRAKAGGISQDEFTQRLSDAGWSDATIQQSLEYRKKGWQSAS